MCLHDAWKFQGSYSEYPLEDLSTRMTALLSRLQDRSALLLENYIDEALGKLDDYIQEHSEDPSHPPAYFSDLKDALQTKKARIEDLKANPPPTDTTDVAPDVHAMTSQLSASSLHFPENTEPTTLLAPPP